MTALGLYGGASARVKLKEMLDANPARGSETEAISAPKSINMACMRKYYVFYLLLLAAK